MIQSLTSDELLRLLTAARQESRRDHLMLLLAFWHGLRVSEVIHLTRESLSDGCLAVRRLKGSRATRQSLVTHENPLLDECQAVFEFTRNMAGNQRLFKIGRRRADQLIKHYGDVAGIPKAKRHMHVLKHTIGTLSYNGCKDIKAVQALLGHASLNSTAVYIEQDPADAARAAQGAVRV